MLLLRRRKRTHVSTKLRSYDRVTAVDSMKNQPPRVAIMKHDAVINQTTIKVFLVQRLKHFHTSLQLLFLQLLILNQIKVFMAELTCSWTSCFQ